MRAAEKPTPPKRRAAEKKQKPATQVVLFPLAAERPAKRRGKKAARAAKKNLNRVRGAFDRAAPYLERIESVEDRDLWAQCIRHRPPEQVIQSPGRIGFLSIPRLKGRDQKISKVSKERVSERVRSAILVTDKRRDQAFKDVVALVHKCSKRWSVYVGRTYVRRDAESTGPIARWIDNERRKGAIWGKVLFRVPRNRILRDEAVAIAVTKFLDALDALCCNNSVIQRAKSLAPENRNVAKDAEQLVYMTLGPLRENRGR